MGYQELIAPQPNERDLDGDVVTYRAPPPPVRTELLTPSEPQSERENASQFWKMVQVLVRRRWTILAVLLLGAGYAALSSLRVVPIYSAVATLEVQSQETQIVEGANVGPQQTADTEFMETQFELIKS